MDSLIFRYVTIQREPKIKGKRQEAYNAFAPVYSWFTEGFDTADLKEAKSLLAELAN